MAILSNVQVLILERLKIICGSRAWNWSSLRKRHLLQICNKIWFVFTLPYLLTYKSSSLLYITYIDFFLQKNNKLISLNFFLILFKFVLGIYQSVLWFIYNIAFYCTMWITKLWSYLQSSFKCTMFHNMNPSSISTFLLQWSQLNYWPPACSYGRYSFYFSIFLFPIFLFSI